MQPISCAIAISLLASLLPALQVSARPVEPDFPCYMRTSVGKFIDLTASMCGVERLEVIQALGSTVPDDVNYNPQYRAVRRDVRTTQGGGSVTTTTSGGVIDDTLYGRDGVDDNVGRGSGQCNTPGDRYTLRDGSSRRCGNNAASERAGGR